LTERTDQELAAASRAGDREAYAALVRRHAGRVYAICLGVLGNADDSEDVAQEAFVKGMARIGTLRDGAQFAGWIATIARNLCRDLIRVRARRRELLERQTNELDGTGDRSPDVADFSALHAALARLPEQYRLPLMLFYFDGQSTARLAGELGISRGAACTRLSRGRRELRRLLLEQEGGDA
jgi:RNA polymerase sigma-70 factor (ECF subfamily)